MAIFYRKPNIQLNRLSLNYKKISESEDEIIKTPDFNRKLKQGYDGFLFYDLNLNLVGYYWFTIDQAPPTSIPKIPEKSVWVFNMLVFNDFRGNGYQKEMLRHLEFEFNNLDFLYADILLDNIPSIKSFLKVGYQEIGIYYILIFGIRRFKNLNWKIGYWNKKTKHTYS